MLLSELLLVTCIAWLCLDSVMLPMSTNWKEARGVQIKLARFLFGTIFSHRQFTSRGSVCLPGVCEEPLVIVIYQVRGKYLI